MARGVVQLRWLPMMWTGGSSGFQGFVGTTPKKEKSAHIVGSRQCLGELGFFGLFALTRLDGLVLANHASE